MNRRTRPLFSRATDVEEPMPADLGRYDGENGRPEAAVVDVLTVGDEATVLRPVQRILMRTGWVIRHAPNVASAVRFLERNRVAVAAVEVDDGWAKILSCLRTASNPPELIAITHEHLPVQDVLGLGAHDLLVRPVNSADLLWSLASAWHAWMKGYEGGGGGAAMRYAGSGPHRGV